MRVLTNVPMRIARAHSPVLRKSKIAVSLNSFLLAARTAFVLKTKKGVGGRGGGCSEEVGRKMGQEGHRGRTRQEGWEEAQKREREDKDQKAPSTLHKGSGLCTLKPPASKAAWLPPPGAPQSSVPTAGLLLPCPYIAAYSRVSPAQGTASKTFGVHRDCIGSLGDINSDTSRCWATTHKKTENPLPGQQAFCRSRAASSQPLGSLKTE